MRICFELGGVRHCYEIPILFLWPQRPPKPGPGPVNYQWLIEDAALVASLHAAATHARDEHVRAALFGGIETAVRALQERAGEHVVIEFEKA